jgi:hypothetical protein
MPKKDMKLEAQRTAERKKRLSDLQPLENKSGI